MFTPGEKVGGSIIVARLYTRPSAITFLARKEGGDGAEAYRVVESLDRAANDDATRRDLFLERSRMLATVRVPGHPSVIEMGEERGVVWVAREFVDGVTFGQLLGALGLVHRGLTPETAATLVVRAARCLASVLAEGGLAHGGVDGDRILVGFDGRVHVVGFLVPKALGVEIEDVRGLAARLFEAITMRRASDATVAELAGSLGALGAVLRDARAGSIASVAELARRIEGACPGANVADAQIAELVAAVIDDKLERMRAAVPPDVHDVLRDARPRVTASLTPGSVELPHGVTVEILLSSASATAVAPGIPKPKPSAAPARSVVRVGTPTLVKAPPPPKAGVKATVRIGGLPEPTPEAAPVRPPLAERPTEPATAPILGHATEPTTEATHTRAFKETLPSVVQAPPESMGIPHPIVAPEAFAQTAVPDAPPDLARAPAAAPSASVAASAAPSREAPAESPASPRRRGLGVLLSLLVALLALGMAGYYFLVVRKTPPPIATNAPAPSATPPGPNAASPVVAATADAASPSAAIAADAGVDLGAAEAIDSGVDAGMDAAAPIESVAPAPEPPPEPEPERPSPRTARPRTTSRTTAPPAMTAAPTMRRARIMTDF